MTRQQITRFIENYEALYPGKSLELIETHISWVLLARDEVFKIKKPLHFSFLDFSTLEKRKHFCEREVELNRRLATDMYRGVVGIRESDGQLAAHGQKGKLIDYAVWMRRMDETRQLDHVLEKGEVGAEDIQELARLVAGFHHRAEVVTQAEDWLELYHEFADLKSVLPVLDACLGPGARGVINGVLSHARDFLKGLAARIEERKASGFVRDGHGDLHCRNILMTHPPVIFDCIEFSDDLRTLDVLSEIGFLCMDLERFGRGDLSEVFSGEYLQHFRCVENEADRNLLLFYKMYRANVRIKVTALALEPSVSDRRPDPGLVAVLQSYYGLFRGYARNFAGNPI